MSNNDTTRWISAYLFYPGSCDDCLIHAVDPFVQQGRQRGMISQFFFIRYSEGGPHIRLRLKCSIDNQPRLIGEVQRYFYRYFRAVRSTAPDATGAPGEGYSVTFVDYLPETARYGGHTVMPTAERQFELSSDTVLACMVAKPGWNYQRAMGVAIQMHLSFAFACKMTLADAIAFFRYVSVVSNYIDRGYQTEVHRAFEKSFGEQKSYLVPYCRQLWDTLTNGEYTGDVPMNDWIIGLGNIHQHYRALDRPADHTLDASDIHPPYFPIYASFVHMTNNRLGILNRDEAYLAYLLVHCLTEIQIR